MPQFLDLVHYYRLTVTDHDNQDELNKILSGPRSTVEDKPLMMTEAAKKLPVPSWWVQGSGATVSQANLVAAKIKER